MSAVLVALLGAASAQSLEIGPAVGRAGPVSLPAGLAVSSCLAPAPAPSRFEPAGRVTLLVRIRRHRVSLVTTASADPGLAPFAPCFERELAALAWPVRRDRVELPIVVAPAGGRP
jgi:hypothetical protein